MSSISLPLSFTRVQNIVGTAFSQTSRRPQCDFNMHLLQQLRNNDAITLTINKMLVISPQTMFKKNVPIFTVIQVKISDFLI